MNEQDRRRKRPKVVLTVAPETLAYLDSRCAEFDITRGVAVDVLVQNQASQDAKVVRP